VVIIGLYSLILILGLVFNASIVWVIVGKVWRNDLQQIDALDNDTH
jgi:hypothetical protein